MPVVATMTVIALLRGDDDGTIPFFDADQMRSMLADGLDGVANDELQAALKIADDLESQLQRYREFVDTSIDKYIEESSNPNTDATDLIEQLEPLDSERADTMDDIIEARRRLIAILDSELWDKVFA
jgi:hypothetical protein